MENEELAADLKARMRRDALEAIAVLDEIWGAPRSRDCAEAMAKDLCEDVGGNRAVPIDICRLRLGERKFAKLMDDPVRRQGPAEEWVYWWNVADFLQSPGLGMTQ